MTHRAQVNANFSRQITDSPVKLTPRATLGKLAAPTMSAQIVTKKSKPSQTTGQAPDFEKSLAELEQIVAQMESGELSLDESLKQFERGVVLARSCQQALQAAEQKVEILLKKSGVREEFATEPFAGDDHDE